MRLNLCWKPCAGSPVRREIISPFCTAADDGFSGTNFNRPGFQEMMGDIENGLVSMVVVKDMSRFGRNYLEVGMYTEIRFPEMGVRFIAVNDGVDSEREDNDFTPFRNIINEWYAKDTSKKIRAVFRNKGMSGQRIPRKLPTAISAMRMETCMWTRKPRRMSG